MKYAGGCHCGNVRFEAEMTLKNALSCNCSICMKRGSLLDFVPESQFKILKGESNLKDYQFNKMVIHHMFCTNCGILPFGKAAAPDGTKMVAVNLRCLDNFSPEQVEITHYNGKDI